jgi:hypothetical protein
MSILKMSHEELFAIVGTCDAIEIETCTPPNLREFICRRLGETQPALAKSLAPRVAELSEKQMHELCEYIQRTHRLIRDVPPRSCGANGHPKRGE